MISEMMTMTINDVITAVVLWSFAGIAAVLLVILFLGVAIALVES